MIAKSVFSKQSFFNSAKLPVLGNVRIHGQSSDTRWLEVLKTAIGLQSTFLGAQEVN